MRWIIGDIHGMLRPLEKLVPAIERRDPERELMFVGDYVNRGPDSKGVIDLLLSLKNARFIRGNHDDVFDQVISEHAYALRGGEDEREANFRWFMQYGLDQTFSSYGVTQSELQRALTRCDGVALDGLASFVPKEHRQFIHDLPPLIEQDDLFVIHAQWPVKMSDSAMADQLARSADLRQVVMWGRYSVDDLALEKPWRRIGYFGHTPTEIYSDSADLKPIVAPQMVLLDTAAALSERGRLTAYCHEEQQFLQVDVGGKVVI